jgi:hypothetical protein
MGVRLIALSFLMPSCRVGPHDVPRSMLDWNGAFPPFRIAGNVHYPGTKADRHLPSDVPLAIGRTDGQARFYAFKNGELLSREMLLALSPRRIESVLSDARRIGLKEEGTGWTLRGGEMNALVKALLPAQRREMERSQDLG